MPRRKGSDAEKAAKKGLDARLELLIRNSEFKQDLVNGQEMYFEYKKAPVSLYMPPYWDQAKYQEWMEEYLSLKNHTKRSGERVKNNRLKFKYVHYLAKWDLNWGPWEYVDTKGMDLPNLSPKELKELFKRASFERDKCAERDWLGHGEPGPPQMFRLPVVSWDPVERERERVSYFIPANFEPEDGEGYVMSEEELDDLVPGQVGKKLTLELNLTFPRDVLEEMVRLNLERVFNRRKEPKKRQRMDKIDFQLRVFDKVKQGCTFRLVRSQFPLPRPGLSTVKSAYLAICGKINSLDTSPYSPFDPATHMS